MVFLAMVLTAMTLGGDNGTEARATETPTAIRLFDLNGDGLLDRIELGADGSIVVALNRGARQFEPVEQALPATLVADVLVEDLNADGLIDMYLVSPGPNLALIGDNTGRFTETTVSLGLSDAGTGVGAERVDIDADGNADVLLHNSTGDVIFWGTGTAFERDPSTPSVSLATPTESLALPGQVVVSTPAVGERPAPDAGRNDVTRDRDRSVIRGAPSGSSRVAVTSNPTGTGPGTLVTPPPIIEPAVQIPFCAKWIEDMTTGDCLSADSTPTLGRLYPLGQEFNLSGTGNCGMGTLTPAGNLHVVGDPGLGSMVISPGTNLNGSSELILSENEDSTFAKFHLRYEGTTFDRFVIQSDTGIPVDRLSIERDSGNVGIGVTLPLERLHTVGNTLTEGSAYLGEDRLVAFHRGMAGMYGQAAGHQFNPTPSFDGVFVEGGLGESGGFFADEDTAAIWSPGDAVINGFFNTLFSVYDEDFLGAGPAAPELQLTSSGIIQQVGDSGLTKAGAHIDAADTTPGTVIVRRYFNNLPAGAAVGASRLGVGVYVVDFGVDISNRFYMATAGDDTAAGAPAVAVECTPRGGNPNALYIVTRSVTTGSVVDGEFFVFIL